ncbi:hypothetical protein niasHT_016776 [Heterodera trifolii]|uniref:Uncharacterized protein n=1 Tax=Heterodera trifolii TaxID=157864 RepID=A0ABD2LER9_9BILA
MTRWQWPHGMTTESEGAKHPLDVNSMQFRWPAGQDHSKNPSGAKNQSEGKSDSALCLPSERLPIRKQQEAKKQLQQK